jgi:hypothetical protein
VNRADIQAEVAAILHRSDVGAAQWDRWFLLAESAIAATLRAKVNEYKATVTAGATVPGPVASMPADWRMTRELRRNGERVYYATPGEFAEKVRDGVASGFFSERGGVLEVGDGGDFEVTYWGAPEPMTADDDESAVAAAWPDLYILYVGYRGLLWERDVEGASAMFNVWNNAVGTVNSGASAAGYGR